MTPLHIAVSNERDDISELMLNHGANVNAIDKYGWSALHHAAFSGNKYSCELLVNGGALVDAKNEGNKTPLRIAANNGFAHACLYLLDKGANADVLDALLKGKKAANYKTDHPKCAAVLTAWRIKHHALQTVNEARANVSLVL